MRKHLGYLGFVFLAAFFVAGCPPLERSAYTVVVGAKAGLVDFRGRHPECAPYDAVSGFSDVKLTPCIANNRLTSGKDAVIDAAGQLPNELQRRDPAGNDAMTPSLLDRYLSAARTISRVAIGDRTIPPTADTFRLRADLSQDLAFEEQQGCTGRPGGHALVIRGDGQGEIEAGENLAEEKDR